MVQQKYFGDDRDYFKYDLIRTVFERSSLRHYVFIPMLTEPRDDNEGRKLPKNSGDKSEELLEFIRECGGKSLAHWRRYLDRYVQSYTTIEPVDGTFFSDVGRNEYWMEFLPKLAQHNSLVFVDPDTGLQTGIPSYLKRMGREKYVLDGELVSLIETITSSSVLMLYQHLPMDKRVHLDSVEKKLTQVRTNYPFAFACAYREDDLAFLFVSKSQSLFEEIYDVLCDYHSRSKHKFKSLHP